MDDIELVNGVCPPELACNFEDDYCGYYNIKEYDEFDWQRGQGQEYPSTGPTVDHTTNTEEGYYAFIDPKYPQGQGDKAWLVSELIQIPSQLDMTGCLSWFYHMKGAGIGNLTLYIRTANKAILPLFKRSGQQGSNWIMGNMTLPPQVMEGLYSDFIFEATIGSSVLGNIALDDIDYTPGFSCEYLASTTRPPPTTTTLSPIYEELTCDFDSGNFCGWYAEVASDIAWVRRNSLTSQYGSSPLNDNTKQSSTGFYAFLDLHSAQKLDTAILKSPAFKNDASDDCFEFWYQMNAPIKTGLSVVLAEVNNRTTLWKRNGNKATNVWSHAYVTVPTTANNKRLEFNGDISYDFRGYLAVDDIRLLMGKCPATQFCDFETDMCQYQHDVSGNFRWLRNKGKTASDDTGPQADHTYQTPEGYYMYIETSYPQRPGQKARLISDLIPKNPDGTCVNFWYHKYGEDVGVLNVLKRVNNKLAAEPLWSLSGNQGDQWKQAQVSVLSAEDFEIVFEGIVGRSYEGDIAIDDIFIDKTRVCSDQAGSCSFDRSTCLWYYLSSEADFELARITPAQMKGFKGAYEPMPGVDTTTDTKNGHLLWVMPGENGTSTLVSETLFTKDYADGGCMSFWYWANGPNPGSLTVFVKYYNQTR